MLEHDETQKKVSLVGSISGPLGNRLETIHTLLEDLTSSPSSHDMMELSMGVATSLDVSLEDESPLVWGIIVGVPGSDKTQRVLTLKGCEHTTFLDTLTVNSFASGYVNDKTGEAGKSLLPDLNGKCLIMKDLTTLFSQRSENVQKILGDLQSIYDGSYAKATGTLGVLSFESQFSILGCITPQALKKHQGYMSSVGGRFLCFGVCELTETEMQEGFDLIWNTEGRKEKVKALEKLVVEHVEDILTCPLGFQKETPDQQGAINILAELMAAGRSVLEYGQVEGAREIISHQTERPWRGTFQLRNLGRALARVHGRDHLTGHELEILRRVVLSSIHLAWGDILRMVPLHPEGLTVGKVSTGSGLSEPWVRQKLKELVAVGILEMDKVSNEWLYYPKSKYQDLLSKPLTPLNHRADLQGEEKKQ
jgi:hypothetical protein